MRQYWLQRDRLVTMDLYGDLLPGHEQESASAVSSSSGFDPLYGETISLQSFIRKKSTPNSRTPTEFSALLGQHTAYHPKSHTIFFGIPPAYFSNKSEHIFNATVLLVNLPSSSNESELRRDLAENVGPVRVVRMIAKRGEFTGRAIIEFENESHAKSCMEFFQSQNIEVLTLPQSAWKQCITGTIPVLDQGPINKDLLRDLLAI
jgi:RNA recognition motif. (a.k.a. RRM, RBD, or RNP domain)